MAFGPDGNLYVGSRSNHSVMRYDRTSGGFIDAFVPTGSGGLVNPTAILFDAQGRLYVASLANDNVLRYDGQTGTFIDTFVSAGLGGLSAPTGMVFGADGNLYVSSNGDDSVKRYDADGNLVGTFVASGSGGLDNPYGLVIGPDGNLFVVSQATNAVLKYNGSTGAFIETFAADDLVNQPTAILFSPITSVPHRTDFDVDGVPDLEDNCTRQLNADQRDTDADGFGNICDADLNNDCIVNPEDLGIFRTRFFSNDPDADFNGDGVVNPIDLGIFRSLFFSPPGPSHVECSPAP
jgi:glucose/arabinose dehydrogenase